MADVAAWPPMIWIGGVQGAGKSTLAVMLAHRHDLPVHRIDLWAYDHRRRLGAGESLAAELDRGAEAAADAFEESSRRRLPLIRDDVVTRELGPVPAIVEGPQLRPRDAGRQPPGTSVWLLTSPEQTRSVRLARDTADDAERLVARDAVLADRLRRDLAELRRPAVEVPSDPDWPAIRRAVEDALAPALRAAPRLEPGRELSRARRQENAAALVQGRLWAEAAGRDRPPPFRFSCECGTSGCTASWTGTPDEYGTPLRAH